MASKAHQFISMCVLRKIKEKGYEIIAFEGDYTKIDTIKYRIPPKIFNHRPDIIGIKGQNQELCIGEAKTMHDLHSLRTKEQFIEYLAVISSRIFNSCKLIIGIPQTAEGVLKNLLKELGIISNKDVSYIVVPEILLPEDPSG